LVIDKLLKTIIMKPWKFFYLAFMTIVLLAAKDGISAQSSGREVVNFNHG